MNKVILQIWEESERGWGTRPDGCSMHIDLKERENYIQSIYDSRKSDESIPHEYDRIVGEGVEAFIEDALYTLVVKDKSIRLTQYQMNNLMGMEEITIKET
jgi:hypothetical protein